jgi:hypothetical protein
VLNLSDPLKRTVAGLRGHVRLRSDEHFDNADALRRRSERQKAIELLLGREHLDEVVMFVSLRNTNELRFVDPYSLAHDKDFPAFGDVGYDEEIEFDEPEEWDEVELVFDGCPDGYVIVVFWRKACRFCVCSTALAGSLPTSGLFLRRETLPRHMPRASQVHAAAASRADDCVAYCMADISTIPFATSSRLNGWLTLRSEYRP